MRKRWLVWAVAALQLLMLFWMIGSREMVRWAGTEYRLPLKLRDPFDPFRGNFLVLSFDQETVPNKGYSPAWNQPYWIRLEAGADGLSRPVAVSMSPQTGPGWLKVMNRGGAVKADTGEFLQFRYPFDRFYINEDRAAQYEKKINAAFSDTASRVWANVKVYRGQGVVTGISINGVPLEQLR